MSDAILVNASSFEIVKDNVPHESRDSKPQLFGYLSVDDESKSCELEHLCLKGRIDKVILVYHDYAFSLLGVSFSENNSELEPKLIARSYKFSAKDIRLEALFPSQSDLA